MASHAFIGSWEVLNCEYVKGTFIGNYDRCVQRLKGIKFRLDENGDVTWTVPEDLRSVPLFSCETYELYRPSGRTGVVLRFGAYAGHVFEFAPDRIWSKDNLKLTCEGLCTLHCIKVNDDMSEAKSTVPFTLLPALEDGYFSDIIITSSNNKQFKVHSTILELQGNDIDWTSDPPPFSNLAEDVLGTILHFLYAECLPDNLTEETVCQVKAAVSTYLSLTKLTDSCQLYLKNMALKQQIISLVNEMHAYLNQVIDRFQPKSNLHSSGDNIASNPSKLCFVVKQSIRDVAVAGVKLVLLCDLFTKRKNELPRNERHEIIRYAKSRLPIFLTQLTRFLQALKNTFSSMSPAQRLEVATFLVPEIEIILDTISMLIDHVERALQQIIQGLFTTDINKCKPSVSDMMTKTLRNILHIRELTKLTTLHEHITCSLGLLSHKKENFTQMSPSQKIRSIARNLDQLIEELPIFLITLEETAAAFDERLEWRDFKFCFKVGTSKVSDILQKLTAHLDSLQDAMVQLCELVQRDAFTQTLQCLGLLNVTASSSYANESPDMTRSSAYSTLKHHSYQFNLVKTLCTPLDSNNSAMSQLCLQLLLNQKNADMEFEIIGNHSNMDQTENVDSMKEDKCIIKAHRVIVAARCDWFRRALLSGMREAIDKKIVIYDTSPILFRILLEYLYSGRLVQNSLTPEQLAELLLLSDKYDMDSLKHTCEYALLSNIDAESVLYFLSIADQYNARILRSRCSNFISQHPELTENDEFFELPISLQAEMFECVWIQPTGKQSDTDFGLEPRIPTSSASSCNSPGVDDTKNPLESMLPNSENENTSWITLAEDLRFEQNSVRMDGCIAQLRDVVGETPSRDILVQAILAADYDLRRAVNYYYAQNNESE